MWWLLWIICAPHPLPALDQVTLAADVCKVPGARSPGAEPQGTAHSALILPERRALSSGYPSWQAVLSKHGPLCHLSVFFSFSFSFSPSLHTQLSFLFAMLSRSLSLSLYMHSQIWVSWPDTGVSLKICFSKHSMFPRLARAVTPSTYLGCSQTLCWIKVKGFYNRMLAWRRNATGLFTQRSKKYRHPSRMMLIRSVWPVGSRDV